MGSAVLNYDLFRAVLGPLVTCQAHNARSKVGSMMSGRCANAAQRKKDFATHGFTPGPLTPPSSVRPSLQRPPTPHALRPSVYFAGLPARLSSSFVTPPSAMFLSVFGKQRACADAVAAPLKRHCMGFDAQLPSTVPSYGAWRAQGNRHGERGGGRRIPLSRRVPCDGERPASRALQLAA